MKFRCNHNWLSFINPISFTPTCPFPLNFSELCDSNSYLFSVVYLTRTSLLAALRSTTAIKYYPRLHPNMEWRCNDASQKTRLSASLHCMVHCKQSRHASCSENASVYIQFRVLKWNSLQVPNPDISMHFSIR